MQTRPGCREPNPAHPVPALRASVPVARGMLALARRLVEGHPSFSAGRTSFEKRVFLAEHLFPEVDPENLNAIVRRAENIDWLTESEFKL